MLRNGRRDAPAVADSTSLRSWVRPFIYFGILCLLAGGGWAWSVWHRDYHFAEVKPGVLYRDGNQSMDKFARVIERVHPKTVVCLVDDNEIASPQNSQFAQELAYLTQKGIRVERIPIKLGGWPTSENVQDFLKTAADTAQQPVLLHCAQGVRRTGMLVAAYQMSAEHFDKQRAKDAILSFGHSDRTLNDIRRFIDEYDPVGQTVGRASTTVPASSAD